MGGLVRGDETDIARRRAGDGGRGGGGRVRGDDGGFMPSRRRPASVIRTAPHAQTAALGAGREDGFVATRVDSGAAPEIGCKAPRVRANSRDPPAGVVGWRSRRPPRRGVRTWRIRAGGLLCVLSSTLATWRGARIRGVGRPCALGRWRRRTRSYPGHHLGSGQGKTERCGWRPPVVGLRGGRGFGEHDSQTGGLACSTEPGGRAGPVLPRSGDLLADEDCGYDSLPLPRSWGRRASSF